MEPGEEEARYGSEDFYDYVIAEGSRDGGLTWLPLLNGYDSGSRPAWKSAYNQRISGQNSLFAGTRELYYRREFLLTGNGNFREGDTLLIRFRLYSDPYAHGWGWAIDNLEIQQNLTPAGAVVTAGSGFRLWPNPAGPQISLLMENAHPAGVRTRYHRPLRSYSPHPSSGKADTRNPCHHPPRPSPSGTLFRPPQTTRQDPRNPEIRATLGRKIKND